MLIPEHLLEKRLSDEAFGCIVTQDIDSRALDTGGLPKKEGTNKYLFGKMNGRLSRRSSEKKEWNDKK